jgi:hypothetical protein
MPRQIDIEIQQKQNIKAHIVYEKALVSSAGGGDVEIIDQDLNIIATVTAPAQYQVEVLTEITDDEDLNTSTIIDPLQ